MYHVREQLTRRRLELRSVGRGRARVHRSQPPCVQPFVPLPCMRAISTRISLDMQILLYLCTPISALLSAVFDAFPVLWTLAALCEAIGTPCTFEQYMSSPAKMSGAPATNAGGRGLSSHRQPIGPKRLRTASASQRLCILLPFSGPMC